MCSLIIECVLLGLRIAAQLEVLGRIDLQVFSGSGVWDLGIGFRCRV